MALCVEIVSKNVMLWHNILAALNGSGAQEGLLEALTVGSKLKQSLVRITGLFFLSLGSLFDRRLLESVAWCYVEQESRCSAMHDAVLACHLTRPAGELS